ncbi:MAG TPA: ABC transporter ATP-binding protein, partial [Pyrinomonadaceae bacterium]|nr:ABC transporter ATP-binding protein [Pyrinomonadaceae bacterium]
MSAIIRVEGLSKQYQIGGQARSSRTLRETLYGAALSPFRRKTGPGAGNTFWALSDVSFDVAPGEVVGVVGRNGAGKSTLLKILSRITEPTSGRVSLYGRVASLLEVGTGFHQELTGRENIFLNGAILGMRKAEIEEKFDEIVAFAEIEKFIDTPVKRYSSGMYVRLAFAVAAHLEPEILIIDEVLAVGDSAFQKKCLGKISSVAQQGRTVLFVSHNMVAVKAMCSRAILLHEGRLVEDGPPVRVVNSYLGAGRISRAEILWNDPAQAPGTDAFRLRSVRVRNSAGEVTSELSAEESFSVEIEYVNLAPGSALGATVLLFNSDGTHVLSSISNHERNWHGRAFPSGVFRSTCRLPGHLLPGGRFDVSVLVWGNNYAISHREDCVVEFEVHESVEMRADYFGDWPGVVRPLLEWDTQHLEGGEGATPPATA